MAYEVKITNETALREAHPELFQVNQRRLRKYLMAAHTLNKSIPGAELVEVFGEATVQHVEEGAATIDKLVGTGNADPLAHVAGEAE